jgi:hypothetical protein
VLVLLALPLLPVLVFQDLPAVDGLEKARTTQATMVDLASYPVGTDPDLDLKQIFVKQDLSDEHKLLFAKLKLRSIEKVASLGSDLTGFKKVAEKVFHEALPPGDEPDRVAERELILTFFGTVWYQCQNLAKARADQRVRMEEEPHKVPEIPTPQYTDMRDRFVARHSDIILSYDIEPHKKFIEKMIRDHTVIGVLPFYELGEIRVRAEKIVPRSGLAETADKLIQIAQTVDVAAVSTDDDAMNRITAFIISLEYTGLCPYRTATYVEGSMKGGSIAYLAELKKQRAEFAHTTGRSTLLFTVLADKKIRQMVERLCHNYRSDYKEYMDALTHVLTEHRYLWRDARDEAMSSTPQSVAASARARAERSRTPPPKRETKPGTPSPPGQGKRALRKQKAAERALKKIPTGARGGTPPPPPPAKTDKAERIMAPKKMWDAAIKLKKTSKLKACEFFNLPSDCKFGKECKLKHICLECGQEHKWYEVHFKG